ncbi:mitochondrial antiviral-signaling protein [Echinops telfairi]|uniref:Mitochondrial antiviral-signaling protein n=2 Tax=Echinops telfairi TaxID=9371 RepID=A0AC55DHI9_ECHTE|nr:mitochondrial antiviral-signaling protein [Echinops telfairi]XP_045151217.1 mitochondrial antiviral-signaling protein [Echinops telfairi]
MTFAEDETYRYIRNNHSQFCIVDVLEILPFLACLTPSDQDRLRASYIRIGNRDTVWELFNSLKRRSGWVASLIQALKACELTDLAEIVASVYQSHLPRNQICPPAPMEPRSVPTEIPGPTAAPSASLNGYREDQPSYPTPVQDTQPTETLGERSEQNPLAPSSGAVPRRPEGPLEPSSALTAAVSPLTSIRCQEQDTGQGSAPTAGMVSSPTSPRGPVSPSVSFQPLSRTTPRASRLPGPPVSAPSTGTSSKVAGLGPAGSAGDQAEATIYSSKTGVPAASVTTSTVLTKVPTMPGSALPSKGPTSPASTSLAPSKLPTMPGNALPSKGPTSPAPSKLPTMPANTVASKGPTSPAPSKLPTLKPPAVMTSTIPPSKLPTNSMRAGSVPRSRRPEETPVAPAPAGPCGGNSPRPEGTLSSEVELSKPEELVSRLDSQPFSGTSQDLAISYSDSLDSESSNFPEENEYVSQTVGSFAIHLTESPSADLLGANSGLQAALKSPMHEKPKVEAPGTTPGSWAAWLGMAAAGALLATVLAVLYRRRLHQ